jgi:hypothetical protein
LTTARWIEKLKTRWKVQNAFQVIIILVVFACTGFTVMFLKPVITDALFEGNEKPLWFAILYWILILPFYNVILLFYGFIFGNSVFSGSLKRDFLQEFSVEGLEEFRITPRIQNNE